MLAKDAACNDEDDLEFRKEPAEGVIAAPPGFETTLRIDGSRTFFVPKNVKPEQFGQTISFTIDGQVTSCTIKVLKHPTAGFTATVKEETAAQLVVSVVNTSDDATGKAYTYVWKVKDGDLLAKDDSKDTRDFTFDKRKLGDADHITIELTAINGTCTSEAVQHDIPVIKAVIADLVLAQTGICEDGSPVEITGILPADGTVKAVELPGNAVTKNADGKTFFNPAAAAAANKLDQSVSFTVNDVAVTGADKNITVFRKPVPEFTLEVVSRSGTGLTIQITDTTLNKTAVYQYAWSFNDSSARTDNTDSFTHTIDLNKINGSNLVVASLVITNGTCTGDTSRTAEIPADAVGDCNTTVIKEMTLQVKSLDRISALVQNPKLVTISGAVIALYKDTLQTRTKMATPEVQLDVLDKITGIMSSLVTSFSPTELGDTGIAVASAALSMVIKLPLYTISCSTPVDDNVKSKLNEYLKKLMDQLPNRAKVFADLNKGKSLSTFMESYTAAFLSGDRDIKKMLAQLMKVINTFIPVN